METAEQVIAQTKKWITDVVVGCNFCPFAAKEMNQNTVHYQVETATDLPNSLQSLLNECKRLEDDSIETSFLIFSHGFKQFHAYLDLVSLAEKLLKKEGYDGVYQVASFHPLYAFADALPNDAANYTNRSIYPMLHLLREESIEKALAKYPNPDQIPEENIVFARSKGTAYMKMLRDACL